MKKLLSSVFVMLTIFCLTACSAPMKTTSKRQNNLSCPFSSKMTVSLEKLTAEGTINRYGEGHWEAEFESPNTLSGVKLEFADGNVTASYKGLSFSVPRSALPVKAMLLNLIEAVDTNAREAELKGSENEGMLEVGGTLEGGDYTLTVDGSGCISSFEMPNNLLKIAFSELTTSALPETLTEEITTEECTAENTEAADTMEASAAE